MKLLRIEIPEINKRSKVLDVGCGQGWAVKEVVEQGGIGFGMDIPQDQLAAASEVLKESFTKQSFLLQGEVLDLPFKSSSFDLAICCETIENVKGSQVLLKEIHRILAPRGFAILFFSAKRAERAILFFVIIFLNLMGMCVSFL